MVVIFPLGPRLTKFIEVWKWLVPIESFSSPLQYLPSYRACQFPSVFSLLGDPFTGLSFPALTEQGRLTFSSFVDSVIRRC